MPLADCWSDGGLADCWMEDLPVTYIVLPYCTGTGPVVQYACSAVRLSFLFFPTSFSTVCFFGWFVATLTLRELMYRRRSLVPFASGPRSSINGLVRVALHLLFGFTNFGKRWCTASLSIPGFKKHLRACLFLRVSFLRRALVRVLSGRCVRLLNKSTVVWRTTTRRHLLRLRRRLRRQRQRRPPPGRVPGPTTYFLFSVSCRSCSKLSAGAAFTRCLGLRSSDLSVLRREASRYVVGLEDTPLSLVSKRTFSKVNK